jgi:MFS family permease
MQLEYLDGAPSRTTLFSGGLPHRRIAPALDWTAHQHFWRFAEVTGISIAYLIPLAFFGPLAGVFVDRWNVKVTMIASDLTRGALALSLVWIHDLWGIYAIFFAISIVSSFFTLAQSVTVRAIVPKEGLMAANALLMQAMQITRILSPSLATAIVSALGAGSCYYIDAASILFSALMLSQIAIHRAHAASSAGGFKTVVEQLFSGMKFIFTHAAISFVVLAMGAGMFAMSCFGPLIGIYVRDISAAAAYQRAPERNDGPCRLTPDRHRYRPDAVRYYRPGNRDPKPVYRECCDAWRGCRFRLRQAAVSLENIQRGLQFRARVRVA